MADAFVRIDVDFSDVKLKVVDQLDGTYAWAMSPVGGGGLTTVNQGTPAAGANAWPVTVTEDTTNTIVKPGDAANKAIRVNIVAGAAAGGTSTADGTSFVAGTTAGTAMQGTVDDAASTTVAEDKLGTVRITPKRAQHVNLRDQSGAEVGIAAAPVRTDPTGTTTQPVSGTVAVSGVGGTVTVAGAVTVSGTATVTQGTAAAGAGAWPVTLTEDTTNTIVKAGDSANKAIRVNIVAGAGSGGTAAADGSAYTAGTTLGTAMQVARDDTGTTQLAEDKIGSVRGTPFRAMHVNLRDNSGNEFNGVTPGDASAAAYGVPGWAQLAGYNGATWDRLRATTANGLAVDVTRVTGGAAASGAAASGNPIRIGARVITADQTAEASGDVNDLLADELGKLLVLPYGHPSSYVNGASAGDITNTTASAVIAAQGAGIRVYVTQVTVTNSHATVGTFVNVLEGTNVIFVGYAAPLGGGFTATFPTPLRGGANAAINIQAVTTGASFRGAVSGYKAAN